jgi:hypothetical protein
MLSIAKSLNASSLTTCYSNDKISTLLDSPIQNKQQGFEATNQYVFTLFNINQIASFISNQISSARFQSSTVAGIRKQEANLVLFPRMHYLSPS